MSCLNYRGVCGRIQLSLLVVIFIVTMTIAIFVAGRFEITAQGKNIVKQMQLESVAEAVHENVVYVSDERPKKAETLDVIYNLIQQRDLFNAWRMSMMLVRVYPEDAQINRLYRELDKQMLSIVEQMQSPYPLTANQLPAGDRAMLKLLKVRMEALLSMGKTSPSDQFSLEALDLLDDVNRFLSDQPASWDARFLQAHLALITNHAQSGKLAAAKIAEWDLLSKHPDDPLFIALAKEGWFQGFKDSSSVLTSSEPKSMAPAHAKFEEAMRLLKSAEQEIISDDKE